jgi:glyoxylase-like metal-dependent hydrolase (beta-lactamase superfamily II)
MLQVKTFVFSPIQENTYVVYNETGQALIIDPGCYFGAEQEQLQQFCTDKSLTPIQLLNTHCHLDHVFGNKWVAKTFGLELSIHPNEQSVLAYAPVSGQKWGLPFENYQGPIHLLREGDEIRLGTDTFTILETPGHSPGSICFYCAEQHFVISGDVLFRESIGRTDLPGGDHDTLLNSIRKKLYTLPDETLVYNGHGMPTRIAHEKQHNPFIQG